MKTMRNKVVVTAIISKLQKYDRRIQKMAENAYKLRQMLEKFLKENEDALHKTIDETSPVGGDANNGAGGTELRDNAPVEVVLGEQPTELPVGK